MASINSVAAFKKWTGLAGWRKWQHLAIVFTDIVDHGELFQHYRDDWLRILASHRQRIHRLVRAKMGFFVKDLGDGSLLIFRDALSAVEFAIELEQNTGDQRIRIRVGIHLGRVMVCENGGSPNVHGLPVNLTERIMSWASKGGIALSDLVHDVWLETSQDRSLKWIDHRNLAFHNHDGTHNIWYLPPSVQRLQDQMNPLSTDFVRPILPIDYWPHLRWKCLDETDWRELAFKPLLVSRKKSIGWKFRQIHGHWAPLQFKREFETLRDEFWIKEHERKPSIRDEAKWHVESVNLANEEAILSVQLATYKDVLLCNNPLGFSTEVEWTGRKLELREALASVWDKANISTPFYPSASPAIVDLMVVTNDDPPKVIISQGNLSTRTPGLNMASVSGQIHGESDNNNRGLPDPVRAVIRHAHEKIGLPIQSSEIVWPGLFLHLKSGTVAFFGEVRSPLSYRQIATAFKKANQLGVDLQASQIGFVKLTVNHVTRWLNQNHCVPYCELGLALCLWRRGLVEIDGCV